MSITILKRNVMVQISSFTLKIFRFVFIYRNNFKFSLNILGFYNYIFYNYWILNILYTQKLTLLNRKIIICVFINSKENIFGLFLIKCNCEHYFSYYINKYAGNKIYCAFYWPIKILFINFDRKLNWLS